MFTKLFIFIFILSFSGIIFFLPLHLFYRFEVHRPYFKVSSKNEDINKLPKDIIAIFDGLILKVIQNSLNRLY